MFNQMEQDYKDPEFNSYLIGPGADLDKSLQPGAQAYNRANQTQNNPRISIFLKYLPKTMTRKGLQNLCEGFGKVLRVNIPQNNSDVAFVDYPDSA